MTLEIRESIEGRVREWAEERQEAVEDFVEKALKFAMGEMEYEEGRAVGFDCEAEPCIG